MKNIKLLLVGLILSLGYLNAQDYVWPEMSTDDTGPWYFVSVLGDNARRGLVWTADTSEDGVERVFGKAKVVDNLENLYKRLWRIEKTENGEYIFINRWNNLKMGHEFLILEKENLMLPILLENPRNTWIIEEDAQLAPYFNIITANPSEEDETAIYVHQGDNYNGRNYTLMMAIERWHYSESSRFTFELFEDKGLIVTPFEGLDFQYVPLERDPSAPTPAGLVTKTMTIYASPTLGGEIEIINNHEPAMYVYNRMEEPLSGEIDVIFIPQEVKEYSLSFTVKCGEAEFEVPVHGFGVSRLPIIDDLNAWYRIQFYQRTGYCMTDKGTGEPLEATIYDANNDAQLWQFQLVEQVGNGIDKFKMISKAGNEIDFEYSDNGGSGNFIAVASSENTFSFEIRPGDGDWQILWNEYESTDEEGDKKITKTNINKSNEENNAKFVAYKANPDLGNSVRLYKENESVKSAFPQFSTETNDYWYYMQFVRVKGKGKNFAIQSSEDALDLLLSQAEIDPENELLRWKFLGDINEFLILDINGNAWGLSSTSIVSPDEANYYSMEQVKHGIFQLRNIDAEGENHRFVNDYGGSSNKVGQYSRGNDGNELQFIPVTGQSINNPGSETEDPVVSTTYYSIQGIQFASKPQVEGIYIEKRIHVSKKVSARKIFIPKK